MFYLIAPRIPPGRACDIRLGWQFDRLEGVLDDYGGAFWGLWGPVGRVLEGPGGRWGAFWEALGGSWAVLEGLGAHFGGRWRHLTPTWQTNVTREVKKHFVRIPIPPFRGKMSPRGAPREPKWRPKGAKGPQNGAQEAPKLIKKGIRS